MVQVLFVSQDKSSDAELVITDVFKPDTWYKLSIRICPTKTCGKSEEAAETANVRRRRATSTPALYGEVRIDCKDPPIGYLEFESNFESLIPYGYAAYGSSLTGGSTVSYTHLRAHETRGNLVCRLLLEKKMKKVFPHASLKA